MNTDTVFIVTGGNNSNCSDSDWAVRAFHDEASAEAFCAKANTWMRAAWPEVGDGLTWDEARAIADAKISAFDPEACTYTRYYVSAEVPLGDIELP